MIYRWLDYDLLVFFQQGIDGHSYSLDDARNECHPFAAGFPAMTVSYPFLNSLPIILGNHSITENRMFQPFLQCVDNEIRCLEVHIRHPKRNQIILAIDFAQCICLYRS